MTEPNAGIPDWLFVPDCRPQSGGGHVSRCVVLAREVSHFCRVHFLVTNDTGRWQQHLLEKGFEVITHAGFGQTFKGVLLDDYNLTPEEIGIWKRRASTLAMIVDEEPVPAELDLVISPSLPAQSGASHLSRTLRGFPYALVDSRYAQGGPIQIRQLARNILVFCGRWDPLNHTGLILDALLKLQAGKTDFFARVFLDGSSPHLVSVRSQVERLSGAAQLRLDAPDLVEATRASDLAVASGGVTLLERCAAGLPSITLITADNQRTQTALLSAAGATTVLDLTQPIDADKIAMVIRETLHNVSVRMEMQRAASSTVDGQGALRVARAMIDLVSSTAKV